MSAIHYGSERFPGACLKDTRNAAEAGERGAQGTRGLREFKMETQM